MLMALILALIGAITWWVGGAVITDHQLEGALDHGRDLFVGVGVEREGGPLVDPPVGECHVLGVDELHVVARDELLLLDVVLIDEWHAGSEGKGDI